MRYSADVDCSWPILVAFLSSLCKLLLSLSVVRDGGSGLVLVETFILCKVLRVVIKALQQDACLIATLVTVILIHQVARHFVSQELSSYLLDLVLAFKLC
jgi:hypothetical protein